MKASVIIKNSNLVKPEGTFRAGIAIEGDKIVGIGRDEDLPPAERVIDAQGNYVIPGLVDTHMHLAYPHPFVPIDFGEAVQGDTAAAAAGGVTTVNHLPIEFGPLLETLKNVKDVVEQNSYIDVAVCGLVMNEGHVKDIAKAVSDFGVSCFKFLFAYRGEEEVPGVPGVDDGLIYLGFEEIGRLAREGYQVFARAHCETLELFFRIKHRMIEQGLEPHWTDARPNFIEADSMLRAINLAKVTGCPLYIVHMTIREGNDIIRKARADGVQVWCETCPHYLVTNCDNIDRVFSKCNPPIRQKEDNAALWEGIRTGVIDAIATDHAAVRKEEKPDLWDGIVGDSGVETMLPVMLSEGVNKGRISLPKMVELCCYNPAKIYGLAPQKGTLEVGSDADIVIIDLEKKVKWSAEKSLARSDFSLYEGWEFQGWPILTMLRGTVVMEEGKITGKPGTGQYLPAKVK